MLQGKVAIVTGAGRGLGRGYALELARRGASVVVNDLGGEWDGQGADPTPAGDVVREIEALGGKAVADRSDVADFEQAGSLVRNAIDTFGRLDILINNAGILRDRMLFNMSPDDWDAVVRVHGRGTYATTHHACVHWRGLAKQTGEPVNARMVHTASESGLYANGGQANYAFAKLGIASFGVVAAREMARYGVTSNVICPRARTRMTVNTFGDQMAAPSSGFDERDAENVAPFVVYLCTDAAAHISGQVFVVAGGLVQLIQQPVPVAELRKDERWTVEELTERAGELFGGRETANTGPAFPGPSLVAN